MNRRSTAQVVILLLVLIFIFAGGTPGFWLYILICAYIAVRLLLSISRSFRKSRYKDETIQREFILKLAARGIGFFFVAGNILYSYVLIVIGKQLGLEYTNVELVVRSITCSLDVFILDVDTNLLDRLDDNPVIRGLIMVQSILALACTFTLILSLIYSRLKAYYLLHKCTKVTRERCHLYLFVGIDENSRYLASDIKREDPEAILIYQDHANMGNDGSDNWSNMVSLFTHRQHSFETADESGAMIAVSSKKISDIESGKLEESQDLLAAVGLEKIRDLINQLAEGLKEGMDSRLHVFLLSDNEDENIRGLINISCDSTILSLATIFGDKMKFYCHARYNGPNRVIEDLAIRKKLNVEIIDSSRLAVELLKTDKALQPVNVVRMISPASTLVARPLDSLVIGFGEVGRDIFRFLYEFGTFIGKDREEGRLTTLKPLITAIDSKMDVLDGSFRAQMPNVEFNGSSNFQLLQLDYRSYRFYSEILTEERCARLNYIVIALGDDERNISLAISVFDRIRRFRKSLDDLLILVQCVEQNNFEKMTKIACHYNEGRNDGWRNVINLFGSPKKIYSYSTVIREELTLKGKQFMSNYGKMRGETSDWDARHNKLTGIAGAKEGEDIVPDIDKLRQLRRKESQDLRNALHAETKMELLRRALAGVASLEDFRKRLFTPDGRTTLEGIKTDIHYPGLSDKENEIMYEMAVLEHARWNAAHEILGYLPNFEEGICNEKTQRHNCLVEWDELDEASDKADWQPCDYKMYDYGVVETSIALSDI